MAAIRGTDFDAVRQGDVTSVPIRFIKEHIAEYKRLYGGEILIEAAGGSKGQITGRTIYLKPETVDRFGVPVTCASFSRFIRLKQSDLWDNRYVFWLLQYLYHFGFMDKYHTQHTGVSRFQWTVFAENEPLPLPPLPTQRNIAAILSAYDDLIENNLRRIKILEEMAQNLYREWFVKFRYPGHQHARFTDSPLSRIPEGWEVATLEDHLVALESGKRPKGGAKDLAFGVPSVGAENVFGIGRHKYQSEKYVSREFFEGMRKGVVKDGDIALYKDGAYIGRSAYFRDSFPHAQFCVNEHVFLLRTTGKRLTQNMLYLWLQEPATVSAIRATNANAAQPGINQPGVNGLSLIVPPLDIAERFDKLAEPSLALIVSLAKRNETLRHTRDLLLPRLISGEVDVSELDITIPEEVAA
ncbi:MAG: restriction endonuclease subunit S [Planctomycetota bacterium]